MSVTDFSDQYSIGDRVQLAHTLETTDGGELDKGLTGFIFYKGHHLPRDQVLVVFEAQDDEWVGRKAGSVLAVHTTSIERAPSLSCAETRNYIPSALPVPHHMRAAARALDMD